MVKLFELESSLILNHAKFWQLNTELENIQLACVLSRFSRVRLCDSVACSPPGSCVHGALQARIPEWVAVPSSRGSSRPRDQTRVSYISCIGRDGFFTTYATWEAQLTPWFYFVHVTIEDLSFVQGGLHCVAYGILVHQPGVKPSPLHWKCRVLTTGPPGKSSDLFLISMEVSMYNRTT